MEFDKTIEVHFQLPFIILKAISDASSKYNKCFEENALLQSQLCRMRKELDEIKYGSAWMSSNLQKEVRSLEH